MGPKHYVKWKTIREKSVRGSEFNSELPDILQAASRGTLLAKILSMKKQRPISFADAARLVSAKYNSEFWISKKCEWYFDNFTEWIAELGYHIELTGDEFEAPALTDKLS